MYGVSAYRVQGTPLATSQSNLPGWGRRHLLQFL